MSNWVQQALPELRDRMKLGDVVDKSPNSIHLKTHSGSKVALITGAPIHFRNSANEWEPLDTQLRISGDGGYGAPGLLPRVYPDGRIRIGGHDQFFSISGKKSGVVNGNKMIVDFPGGQEVWTLREMSLKHEIVLFSPPPRKFHLNISRKGSLPPGFREEPILCMDAAFRLFVYTNDNDLHEWLKDAAYPVTIDPTATFTASSGDGYVYGENATYSTARSTSTAFDSTGAGMAVGQQEKTGTALFSINRSFLVFDTSSLGGVTIQQNNLLMVCVADNSTAQDFDVNIQKQTWSAQDPLGAGNREAAYDNCLAATLDQVWKNTGVSFAINTQYTSPNLDNSRVNGSGSTYFSLISSRDVGGNAPATDTNEFIQLAASEHGTSGYRPVLSVVYGTTYNQSASGAITPSGALTKKALKSLAGAITPAGAIVKRTFKSFTGAATPAGALSKTTLKGAFTGSLTPAGALIKKTLKLLGGAITPVGFLLRDIVRLIRIRFAAAPQSDIITGSAPEGKTRTAAAPESDTSVQE